MVTTGMVSAIQSIRTGGVVSISSVSLKTLINQSNHTVNYPKYYKVSYYL